MGSELQGSDCAEAWSQGDRSARARGSRESAGGTGLRASLGALRRFPRKGAFLVLALVVAVVVGGAGLASGPRATVAPVVAEEHGSAPGSAHDGPMKPVDMMLSLYHHLEPHDYSPEPWFSMGPLHFTPNNHHVSFLIAFAIVFLLFTSLAVARKVNLAPRGAIQNALESVVLFIRDDMVYSVMGKEMGNRFLPLFLTQFFLILVMNLMGILPSIPGLSNTVHLPATATANMAVTGGLAMVTLMTILVYGIREQGAGAYVKNLAPHVDLGPGAMNAAIQKFVMCLLYPIEVLGLVVKPVALMIRLFANMTGGHMALLTIYGLVYVAGAALPSAVSYSIGGVAVAINVFLTMLELLVAFIQAYVFTYLSIIFVQAAVHPEH